MFENPELAFGGTKQLLSLIETIYASVEEPSLWTNVMEGIAKAVNGESSLIFARFPKDHLIAMVRTDEAAWDAYAAYYSSINVLMQVSDQKYPDGVVRYGHEVISDREFEKTEFYNDFFKPGDMHHSIGVKIPLGTLPAAFLTTQRPKIKGPFDECEGLVYETLLPHLQRALALHMQLTETRSSIVGLETALDAFAHAVFGLNREGRVVFSNKHAEAIARAGDPIIFSNGRLSAVFPEQNSRFQTLLSNVIAARSLSGVTLDTSLLLERKSGRNPLRITATPFPSSSLPGSPSQLSALLFVSDPEARSQSRGAILRTLYALTPTEVRVADSLLQGLETREVADALGLTLDATRFHAKRILSKTGTRRQTELMRLMLSLPQL